MSTINQLPLADTVEGGDQAPVWKTNSGDTRRAPYSLVRTYILTDVKYDLGEYTVANLPSPVSFPGFWALATDASGGRTAVRSDGTNWKVMVVEGATVTT